LFGQNFRNTVQHGAQLFAADRDAQKLTRAGTQAPQNQVGRRILRRRNEGGSRTFCVQAFDESDRVVCVWTKRDDCACRLESNYLFVELIGVVTASQQFHAGLGRQCPANVFEVFEAGA
jgi:hypothetical protein